MPGRHSDVNTQTVYTATWENSLELLQQYNLLLLWQVQCFNVLTIPKNEHESFFKDTTKTAWTRLLSVAGTE
jgi:hypothetical protein